MKDVSTGPFWSKRRHEVVWSYLNSISDKPLLSGRADYIMEQLPAHAVGLFLEALPIPNVKSPFDALKGQVSEVGEWQIKSRWGGTRLYSHVIRVSGLSKETFKVVRGV